MLTEAEKATLPYGCLMLVFDLPKWPQFVEKFIDSEDFEPQKWMEGKAKYEEPHVTLLYGFEQEVTLDQIKPLLMPLEDINVEFKDVSVFYNTNYTDEGAFDLVKFGCESDQLRQIRKVLETLPNKQTYSEYNPHATIAYVKAGKGKKYDGATFTPFTLKPNKYLFSAPDKSSVEFVL